jgi:hypothetical protein
LAYLENARQRVITEIQARGGTVESERSLSLTFLQGRSVTKVTLWHSRTADFDLECLRLFPNIEKLTLVHTSRATKHGDTYILARGIEVDVKSLGDGSLNAVREEWLRAE